MRIDLTCPVELWNYALPTRQYPVCRLQLFNLTESNVVSVQAIFTCYNAAGEMISRQVERAQGLNGLGRSAFEMTAEIEGGEEAAMLDFSIEKVWYENGNIWRHAPGRDSDYRPNTLPEGRRREVLRHLAGEDAAGFPSDQGAVWLCVCGRPNSPSEENCRRCGREKRDTFTRFNEAEINKIILEYENAAEEKERQERTAAKQAAEEKARIEKEKLRRKRRKRWTAAVALITVVLGFGIYFYGLPFYRYTAACRQLENGVYASAKREFEALAEQQGKYSVPIKIDAIGLNIDLLDNDLYKKSAELVKECTYRQAKETMSVGTITALKNAEEAFGSLGDYSNSAELAKQAKYQRAGNLLLSGQYETAEELFAELSGYSDADQRRESCVYQNASALMEQGDYETARTKFLSLGSYSDAAEKANQCIYQPAMEKLNSGDYLAAIDLLEMLPKDFANTAVKLQEANYGAAGEYFKAGDYDIAAEYYLAAGDYLNAFYQATACLYEPACLQQEAGNYAEALEMFAKIPAYEDSTARMEECKCRLAEQAAADGDYLTARSLLSDIGSENEEAASLKKEYTYLPACELQNNGSLVEAEALFETIPGYKDTDGRLNSIRYDRAVAMLNAHEYESAIGLFDALGDYKDSAACAVDARYGLGIQLLNDGKPELAAPILAALGNYQNAESYLQRCYYEQGVKELDEGNLEQAAKSFKSASDYGDAENIYQASVYQLAQAAAAEGRMDDAIDYYAQIPNYQDADMLRMQCIYTEAEANQEVGNLSAAAMLFASVSGYEDAAERAEACYDAYYQDAYNSAKTAMKEGNYLVAINVLQNLSRENLSSRYSDIETMYQEANYKYANELYEQKKPF